VADASSDRPKARSFAPLAALKPFARPYRGRVLLALAALIIAAVAMLALPLALRQLIDHGLAANSAATIDQYFWGFLAAAVAFGVFAALRFYHVTWVGERIVADVRAAVYARVIRMDPTFFEVTRTGEVLSRLTTDTTLVQTIAGSSLSIALRSVLSLIGALVLLALTSPKLTGALAIMLPLVIVPLIVVGRRVRALSRASQDRIADASGLAGETLNAIQTVQAYTLEALQSTRFNQAVEDSFDTGIARTKVRALLTAIGTMLVFGALTAVLWLGAHEVLAGRMTGGALSQFLLYAIYVGSAAAMLSETYGEIQRGAGAMERLSELLAATPAIRAPLTPAHFPSRAQGRIQLQDVSFRYPSRPDTLALDQIAIDIAPGETVALVGPSGAGKSTLFQLLLRFYDPAVGCVRVDGIDIASVAPDTLRRQIGLVPQDTVLFGATARENIGYGRPGASDHDITQAAHAAAADEFLSKLPQGYDSFLGERGLRLSGGQRQRLAIARAVLKDPPILLLDEATSALDAESERLVQEALEKLMQNRTTIIIAHRLATVQKADRILVMDQGRIVGQGRHADLIHSNPLYARLAALQFQAASPPLAPSHTPA
jgi:ATP-binding cassette, subfamily B, bacterial